MATGNGAYIVHKFLESKLHNYQVNAYHPYWTLMPCVLPLFSRKKADIIHTTPDYACFFKQQNTPLVTTLHNYVLDPFMQAYSSNLQYLHYQTDLKWFTKKALEQAKVITSVSHFTAQLAKQHLQLDREIKVIPNGIDTDLFYPAKQAPNDKKIKVLFSGNLTRRKGAQWLQAIAQKLNPNIEILYTQGLNNSQWTLAGDNMRCLGTIPYKQMPRLYNSVDMLLMPTVREGASLAVLEAMACGLPVVATNCSSMPELVVPEQGGYLCQLGDTTDFADKINLVSESSKSRKLMGEYNRNKIVDDYTATRMLKNYARLFEQMHY